MDDILLSEENNIPLNRLNPNVMNASTLKSLLLTVMVSTVIFACNTKNKTSGNNNTDAVDPSEEIATQTDSVATPFGWFHRDHVHHYPGGVITNNADRTTTITLPDGSTANLQHADTDTPSADRPAASGLPTGHEWLNYASFYTERYVEVGTFNAKYIVPNNPTSNPQNGNILYYFIGVQDNQTSPLTILQPVLGFNGANANENYKTIPGWSLANWNCCPSGQTIQGNIVTGMQPGDTIATSMIKSDSTYTITATWKGQNAILTQNTGSEFFDWPNVTLEVYGITACDEFVPGAMTFFDLEMMDTDGNAIPMKWSTTGDGKACNTKITYVDATTITIEQN